MTQITKLFAIAGFSISAGLMGLVARAQNANPREVLWYRSPAPVWDDALPIGNGRLGAMVFGGANAGANNGDLQVSPKYAPLMDGSQTSGADEHLPSLLSRCAMLRSCWRSAVSMSITQPSGAGCSITARSWSSDCEGISSRQTSRGEWTKPTFA